MSVHLVFLGSNNRAPFRLRQRLERLLVLDARPIVELKVEAEDLTRDLAILQCTAVYKHRLSYKHEKKSEN